MGLPEAPGSEKVIDRIAEVLALADSDYKWAAQVSFVTLSALAGLAVIPLYLSSIAVAYYVSTIGSMIVVALLLRDYKFLNWMTYVSVLCFGVVLGLGPVRIASWIVPLSGGPDDLRVFFPIIGTWLIGPIHLGAAYHLARLNTVRLQLETLYFRTISGELPAGVDPLERLTHIWHHYWWQRVFASVWPSAILYWKHLGFLRRLSKDGMPAKQIDSIIAGWLIEGYPESMEAYARRKGVDQAKRRRRRGGKRKDQPSKRKAK